MPLTLGGIYGVCIYCMQIGTYQMAVMAKALNKPFYVVAESFKFVRMYPLNQRDLPNDEKVYYIFLSLHPRIYMCIFTYTHYTQSLWKTQPSISCIPKHKRISCLYHMYACIYVLSIWIHNWFRTCWNHVYTQSSMYIKGFCTELLTLEYIL